MTKKESLSNSNSRLSILTLQNMHPQIREKCIFDYINGLEVLEDHLRVRSKSNEQFFGRVWESITGQAISRQQLVDQNITTSLNSVAIWLQSLQLEKAESDLAISHLADKLLETRTALVNQRGEHKALADRLHNFSLYVSSQLSDLKICLSNVDAARLASSHLEQVFDKWEAGRLEKYPPLIRLFLTIDELHWGNFGTFFRLSQKEDEKVRLKHQLVDKSIVQMKKDLGKDLSKLMLSQDWLSPIHKLSPDSKEAVLYLSDWASPSNEPIISAMRYAALPEQYFPHDMGDFPYVLSGRQVINHMIYENNNRK